jgi:hypothetical protein
MHGERIYLLEQARTQMKIPPKRKLGMHYWDWPFDIGGSPRRGRG